MARPRNYDQSALIAQAMEFFWARGYRGTSIEELVLATGVNRATLYSAYPDKHELFIESIRRYLEEKVEGHLTYLRQADPARAVRRFIEHFNELPAADLQRGCMLANTAAEIGLRDKEAAALVRQALKRLEDALYARLAEAREAGTLAAGVQPRRYARELIALLQGLRMMARVGIGRRTLKDAARAALSPLSEPAKGKAKGEAKGEAKGTAKNGVRRASPKPSR